MERERDNKQHSWPRGSKELERWGRRLAVTMVIAFAVPTVAIIFLSIMVWRLSVELNEVHVLTDVSNIETRYQPFKNYGYAIAAYKDLVEQSEHPLAYARLAELAVAAGDLELARQIAQQVHTTDDLSWEFYSTLSYLSLVENNEREAIRFGEEAIEKNLCDVQSLNNVAWIYATTDDQKISNLEKAEQYALRAVECSNSRHPDSLDTLAEIYLKTGKTNLAEEQIRRAIEIEEGTSRYLHERLNEIEALIEQLPAASQSEEGSSKP